jgi:hypothetical protein
MKLAGAGLADAVMNHQSSHFAEARSVDAGAALTLTATCLRPCLPAPWRTANLQIVMCSTRSDPLSGQCACRKAVPHPRTAL